MSAPIAPLLTGQPATRDGQEASRELIEVVQNLAAAVTALQGKLDAVAAIAAPTGGATTDTEARAAIDAILAALN